MHDSEHVHDAILDNDVVHDAVVANPEAVERISGALDRPYLLPADPPGLHGRSGELLEARFDPRSGRRRQLAVGACGRRRE